MDKMTLSALVALSLTTAPLAAQNNDQVSLRVVHAVQGIPAVSVSLGETKAFDNVAFKQVTPWKSFPQVDDLKLKISLADGRELKTTEEFSFDDDDQQYTILVTPDTAGPNPKVVVLESDKEDDDDDNESEITLINASPDHKSLNLVAGDNTLERGVNYGKSGDEDIAAGAHTLKIVDADKDTAVASQSVNIPAGASISVIVMGGGAVRVINDDSPDQDLSSGGATAASAATAASTTATQTPAAGSATTTGTM